MNMVPRGHIVTYRRIVVYLWSHKYENNCMRLTVGGDHIDYPWDASTPTSDLTTSKILFDSTIYTPGATFITMDVKNFYINMPFYQYKYMRIKLDIIPDKVIKACGL